MNDNNGSASALIESGRGGEGRAGSRFDLRLEVLKGVCANPGNTINENSVFYFDWYREPYKNATKRADDLAKLGYIVEGENRHCRYTGKSAHTYRVTEKGRAKLSECGMLPVAVEPDSVAEVAGSGRNISSLRSLIRKNVV